MSRNLTAQETAALARYSITTALLVRLDFRLEPVFVWTGQDAITPTGYADSLLNNQTFQPLANGVLVNVGENTFTTSGSDSLSISLAIPASAAIAINAAMYYPAEYQCRPATIWRALIVQNATPGNAPIFSFRRIRTGTIDELRVSDDGLSRRFEALIESHAGRISNASGSTYLDQKRLSATDTSQDYAVACANGSPAPSQPAVVPVVNPASGSLAGYFGQKFDLY